MKTLTVVVESPAKRTCFACAHSSMAPDDDYLVCNNPEAGASQRHKSWGTYMKGRISLVEGGELASCGEEMKFFEQHPRRNQDGTLKG